MSVKKLKPGSNAKMLLRDESEIPEIFEGLFSWVNWGTLWGPRDGTTNRRSPNTLLNSITVDTVHLSIPLHTLRIHPDHQLSIKVDDDPAQNHVLWVDDAGNTTVASRASWHCPGFSLHIKPLKRGWLDGAEIGCFVAMSFPGYLGNKDNSWPVNRLIAMRIVQLIEQQLRGVGVEADLLSAQVTRCDLNRNIVLSKPFSRYKDVWDSMTVPRTQKETRKLTGVVLRNKSRSVLFYDKNAQMKSKGQPTTHLPPNLARFEWQIRKAVNVRKNLGVGTLRELLIHWEELSVRFLDFEKKVFGYDVTALQAPRARSDKRFSNPVTPQIQSLMRACRKQGVELEQSSDELEHSLRTNGFESYARVVKAIPGLNKTYVNAHLRRMEGALVREKALTDSEFVQKYNEVHDKLQRRQHGANWVVYGNAHSRFPSGAMPDPRYD